MTSRSPAMATPPPASPLFVVELMLVQLPLLLLWRSPWWSEAWPLALGWYLWGVWRSPRWWRRLVHLSFSPLLVWVLSSTQASAPLALLALVALLLVFGRVALGAVPLFLSPAAAVSHVATLHRASRLQFLDLGAGTGRVLRGVQALQPHWVCTGVEQAWLPWLLGWWSTRTLPERRWLRADFWRLDWSQYDVIYCFLSPAVMAQVADKAQKEMRAGSVLVSYAFALPALPDVQTLHFADGVVLYQWQAGGAHA